jgi:hypothetical protein
MMNGFAQTQAGPPNRRTRSSPEALGVVHSQEKYVAPGAVGQVHPHCRPLGQQWGRRRKLSLEKLGDRDIACLQAFWGSG